MEKGKGKEKGKNTSWERCNWCNIKKPLSLLTDISLREGEDEPIENAQICVPCYTEFLFKRENDV